MIGDSAKTPISVFWRYIFIRGVQYGINSLVWFRDLFDIKTKRLQIIKDYQEGERSIILDAHKLEKEYITISDIINKVDDLDRIDDVNTQTSKPIFLKFELHLPDTDPICLKKYIQKYHNQGHHHHTLKNILDFNELDIPVEDAKLKIIKMEKGKRNILEFSYNDVHHNHISYFFDLQPAQLAK